eukprot:g11499.t1
MSEHDVQDWCGSMCDGNFLCFVARISSEVQETVTSGEKIIFIIDAPTSKTAVLKDLIKKVVVKPDDQGAKDTPEKTARRRRSLGDTLVVGLTGSIGMGKSTVSKWLQEMQIPLDDADATVHRLYAPGGEAVLPLKEAFGSQVLNEEPFGGIDRGALSKLVVGEANSERLKQLEAIVHPLVEASRDRFIHDAQRRGELLCVLDIPLLFEKQLEKHCDLVVVVSAPAEQQRRRVLARPEMTPEKFTAILAKQADSPDSPRKDERFPPTLH